MHNIAGPVADDDYRSLLRVVAPLASSFGLILRMSIEVMHEPAKEVLTRLGGYLVEAGDTQAWPGSQIVGTRTVERYLFRLDANSLDVLVSSASNLFDWVNPMLPEDLHLLREDGSTVLGTIAQEDDAWLELTASEYEGIANRLPHGVLLPEA